MMLAVTANDKTMLWLDGLLTWQDGIDAQMVDQRGKILALETRLAEAERHIAYLTAQHAALSSQISYLAGQMNAALDAIKAMNRWREEHEAKP